MDRTERFYRIQQLLRQHRAVPIQRFLDTLEISLATFKRDLEYMRSRLNIPIVWDRESGGYRYENAAQVQELPGVWFSDAEVYALLTMQQLLENLEPGLLAPHIAPLLDRLKSAIGSHAHSSEEVRRRIRILQLGKRTLPLAHFEIAAKALLERKRLHVVYYTRARDEETARDISPQRLVHYRDNWYLDAWCHLREGIRSFALDAIRSAEMLDERALDVPEPELDRVLSSGYGIFSGADVKWAKLRFTPQRARWVQSEQWHPQQRSTVDADGAYMLEIPYSDIRELLGDILRFAADIEVLEPPELRNTVATALRVTLEQYQRNA